MEINLLDRMLNTYLSSMTPVSIILQNKVKVKGIIKAFDSYVIIIEGHKREIVYRHAVSSLAASVKEPKIKPSIDKSAGPERLPAQKSRSHQEAAPPAASSAMNINNSMKEGLLKWMQEQKAAK